MNALMGFAPMIQEIFGSTEHFLAFYLSVAVLASLTSHMVSLLWLSRIKPLKSSLGASGALWAILAGLATLVPQLPVGIVFLPGVAFTMSDLIPALIAFDLVGLVRGWSMLDHAAHLGGAALGYFYVRHGYEIWAELNETWDETRKH
ncbi:hypothetical protein HDU86_004490 [Geranomyces michiganensis]|nr:hypothetical protein HDU86_004490 [Geranomyces michiganensis]